MCWRVAAQSDGIARQLTPKIRSRLRVELIADESEVRGPRDYRQNVAAERRGGVRLTEARVDRGLERHIVERDDAADSRCEVRRRDGDPGRRIDIPLRAARQRDRGRDRSVRHVVVPEVVVGEVGCRVTRWYGGRDAPPAEDNEPASGVGAQLAEEDLLAEEFSLIEGDTGLVRPRDRPVTRIADDERGAGGADHRDVPRAAGHSRVDAIGRWLMVERRLPVHEVDLPGDRGVGRGDLAADCLPAGVVLVVLENTEARGLSFDLSRRLVLPLRDRGLAVVSVDVDARMARRLGTDEELVWAVADARNADGRVDLVDQHARLSCRKIVRPFTRARFASRHRLPRCWSRVPGSLGNPAGQSVNRRRA